MDAQVVAGAVAQKLAVGFGIWLLAVLIGTVIGIGLGNLILWTVDRFNDWRDG